MNIEGGLLRLEIGGRWSAADMEASLRSLLFLYDLRLYLNHLEDIANYWDVFPPFGPPVKRRGKPPLYLYPTGPFLYRPEDVRQFSRIYFPEFSLAIARIEYASPGIKDFLGIGEILKQIREFVQFLIMLPEEKEHARLKNSKQRIENARNFVRLRVEHASANIEIEHIESGGLASIVDENTRDLAELIEDKKITAALTPEDTEQ